MDQTKKLSKPFFIPRVEIKINKERINSIPVKILQNIQLLGDCVCEELKRRQNFSQSMINERTKLFLNIMASNGLKISDCYFNRVSYEYKLTIASDAEVENERLRGDIDLLEILDFCKNKLLQRTKKRKSDCHDVNLNNSQQQIESFPCKTPALGAKKIHITSYNDVLKILKPIKDYAALRGNTEGLDYISKLEHHIYTK